MKLNLLKALTSGLLAIFWPIERCCDGAVEINCNFEQLLDAIEKVESSGNPNAVGDNGEAIGAYQIHKIYVDEVNRILGWHNFSYDDRWDRDKSRWMVSIYLRHYGKGKSVEAMARIHNGDPVTGWRDENTKPYWLKVKAELENLE